VIQPVPTGTAFCKPGHTCVLDVPFWDTGTSRSKPGHMVSLVVGTDISDISVVFVFDCIIVPVLVLVHVCILFSFIFRFCKYFRMVFVPIF